MVDHSSTDLKVPGSIADYCTSQEEDAIPGSPGLLLSHHKMEE